MKSGMQFSLIEEFKNRKYIITNTDLDGMFCASVLCKHFPNLEIGGFSNSYDKIWVNENVDVSNSIYLDLFLTKPQVLSIDNHIVGFNGNENYCNYKINPNIIRHIGLNQYRRKYPFSTFVFLLRILETKGYDTNINIDIIIGETSGGEKVYLWELMLRADDTLSNTFLYRENAQEWWGWVLKYSKENSLLQQLYNKLKTSVCNIENATYIKQKVQTFLTDTFGISRDGFKDIYDGKFKYFVETIGQYLNCSIVPLLDLKTICLKLMRQEVTSQMSMDDFKTYNIKTLAFVKCNLLSFSYI